MAGLLTVSEVADYLKTTTTTVYRWIRMGKLTAVKIGKEWRVDEALLHTQLSRYSNKVGTVDNFWQSLRRSEHIMLMTTKNADISKFEVSLYKKGLDEGAMLMKGCWWQDEQEVVEQYMRLGLDAASLIKDGILSVFNLSKLYINKGIDGPVAAWRASIEASVSRGATRLWASGSPSMNCCGDDPNLTLAFEKRLNSVIKDTAVVGFCPYSLEDGSNMDHFEKMILLMSHHSGVAFYNNGQLCLMRQ
jgi:excisionase family DNA binding protein